MDLTDIFPPFGLRIEAGPLVLRPITDEALPALVELSMAGIHDPSEMPFSFPWTQAPLADQPFNYVRFHWGVRSTWNPQAWDLELAVEYEGELVGCQGFITHDYLVTRTGETGSWLGQRFQGMGIGTQMRQAICAFCFDHLDAQEITSGAFLDNPASLAVSRKVGYQPNGVRRMTRRPGEWAPSQALVLTPDTFVRGPEVSVTGVEAFRTFIGLSSRPSPG